LRFVIVGGTAGLGRALAERLASEGHELVLVATDERDLRALAAHLSILYETAVELVACDLVDPTGSAAKIVRAVDELRLDGLFIVAGLARDNDDGTLAGQQLADIIAVNLTSAQELVSAFLPRFLSQGYGAIVGFGSIAAVRGRGRNVAYASAKRGLRSFFESILLVTRDTGVEVQFYELGYVATQQTFGRRLFPPPTDPARLAEHITSKLGSGSHIGYLPAYWGLAAIALRFMPAGLFKRIST
jgi:short-subunit dehydrogenase